MHTMPITGRDAFFRGANFHRSKRLKWLLNQLVNLNVDLELARNEASHERVTALEIEIDVMKVDKIVLETQTAEAEEVVLERM